TASEGRQRHETANGGALGSFQRHEFHSRIAGQNTIALGQMREGLLDEFDRAGKKLWSGTRVDRQDRALALDIHIAARKLGLYLVSERSNVCRLARRLHR